MMKQLFMMLLAVVSFAVVVPMPGAAEQPGEKTPAVPEIRLVDVPGGCFARKDGQQVCVSGFRIGKYEVTQGQWEQVMEDNPANFWVCGADCPVESVSWDEVQVFIETLNARSGMKYRLPTEAEWEYACRGGGNDEYCGSSKVGEVAWFMRNAENTTHKVGSKQPNALGIYDMSGNVWEWCSDWFGEYPAGKLQDYQGPPSGGARVIRGGGWDFGHGFSRAANRSRSVPESRYYSIGFRLVLPAVQGAGTGATGTKGKP